MRSFGALSRQESAESGEKFVFYCSDFGASRKDRGNRYGHQGTFDTGLRCYGMLRYGWVLL
jgi:hypothetical protein